IRAPFGDLPSVRTPVLAVMPVPGLLVLPRPVLLLLVAGPERFIEVANAELDAECARAFVRIVEMPVMRHARRHVDRVACLPLVALTVDERISASLEHVEHGLGMGVAVALRMRRFLEDRRHRDGLRAKAIRLVGGALAAAHED